MTMMAMLLVLLTCLGTATVQGQNAVPGPLRVGVSSADITPEGPVWMRGFAARDKQSDGIERPISAHCVVFDNGQTRAAVVALDLCALSYRQLQRLRAAGAAVGIPEQHA